MIVYDLQCGAGHLFEGWFADADEYGEQLERGLISCPVCDSGEVVRVPSTFGIKSSTGTEAVGETGREAVARVFKKVAEYVENNFENVGSGFATEALKIHYGAAPARNIRGTSTEQEEKMLAEEGVSFMKLPAQEKDDSDA
ncbi:MAG: DUF1178 family protein [Desulfatibacillaceae bacterium]